MLHVIDRSNRHLYEAQIEQHYRIRYDIYVKTRGWKELDRADGLEKDNFDTDAATYLLAFDDNGNVIGGSRLVPTVHPHLLSEVFPHMASVAGLQRGPEIVEWTRYFVVPERRNTHQPCDLGGLLASGVYEHCLNEGYRTITALFETYWLTRLLEFGWHIRPLGLPELMDGYWSIAGAITVNDDGLESVRATWGIRGPILEYHVKDAPLTLAGAQRDTELSAKVKTGAGAK
jgi:acyl-homoserine lactone synthase